MKAKKATKTAGNSPAFSGAELSRVAAKETRKAYASALKTNGSLLAARDGWIVKLNSAGKVTKKVEKLATVRRTVPDLG